MIETGVIFKEGARTSRAFQHAETLKMTCVVEVSRSDVSVIVFLTGLGCSTFALARRLMSIVASLCCILLTSISHESAIPLPLN